MNRHQNHDPIPPHRYHPPSTKKLVVKSLQSAPTFTQNLSFISLSSKNIPLDSYLWIKINFWNFTTQKISQTSTWPSQKRYKTYQAKQPRKDYYFILETPTSIGSWISNFHPTLLFCLQEWQLPQQVCNGQLKEVFWKIHQSYTASNIYLTFNSELSKEEWWIDCNRQLKGKVWDTDPRLIAKTWEQKQI